jgi:hypothetical protein
VSREIFISYRRDDAAGEVGPLAYALRTRFGDDSVFLDTSDIPVGGEWPAVVREAVGSAAAVVCVIGPEWILTRDEWGRRRIDDSDDWVRHELELALDSSALVVPVLVRHAPMPPRHALPKEIASLADRHAVAIRDDSWSHDVERVLGRLQEHLGGRTGSRPFEAPPTVDGAPGASANPDDFRAIAVGFEAPDIPHRDETADAIRELAASLDLDDVLPFARSRKTAERVGAAVALGVHVRSSAGTRRDRRVLSAVGELLADRSSLVRYRAAELVRSSPSLVANFEDELRRLAETDANAYVRRMAQRALTAARR